MLERQQSQLVTGLQELYKRVQNGQGWAGSPLNETGRAIPLTHDILERLGALKQGNPNENEQIGEQPNAIRQRLISSGAGYMQRSNSTDSDLETDDSLILGHMPPRQPDWNNSVGIHQFAPTSPNSSPSTHPASTLSAICHQCCQSYHIIS
jgi:hypothetical protein